MYRDNVTEVMYRDNLTEVIYRDKYLSLCIGIM